MTYVPTYSEVEDEIVSVTLNLSNYVTQKEFKNVTKVDTSDFALKTNVAEIKKKFDDIDVDKIDFIDELPGKNFIEDSYLYFKPEYRYFKTTGIKSVLSWKSIGLSDEKLKSIQDDNFPELLYDKEKAYLNFGNNVLSEEKITYTHDHIINLYITYSMPYITYRSDPDTIGQCFLVLQTIIIKNGLAMVLLLVSNIICIKILVKNTNSLIILGADLSDYNDEENKKIIN